ncbi:hypothetical protein [Cypionkella sinensis]
MPKFVEISRVRKSCALQMVDLMPTVNVIINGDFDQGSTGWTGTDLETNYTHDVYVVGGTPTNHVAEMDGTAAAVTVMQQSFMIDQAGTYPLPLFHP